jgi:hypothetical protein
VTQLLCISGRYASGEDKTDWKKCLCVCVYFLCLYCLSLMTQLSCNSCRNASGELTVTVEK